MPSDVEYLRRAMRLARKGVGKVSPNPLVGCVLVKGGRIVGEGYHPYFGGPHAEIGALEKAGPKAREAALYVNLEPCNCWGKTGPCTAAILQAGISRVVASMADPDPRVSGKGFQVLRQAGIQVRSGLLEAEARDLNRPYLIWTTQKRPYVILKSAATLDGKIAARNGKSRWISSKASRNYVHRLRSQVDAILVGTRTVLQDDPELTSHGQGKNPVRIILDAGGVLTPQQKVFNGSAQTLLMTSGKNFNLLAKRFEKEKVAILALSKSGSISGSNGRIHLKELLKILAQMNVGRLLVEGGGELHASLIQEGLADELQFFIAPKILGGKEAKTSVEGKGFSSPGQAVPVSRWSWRPIGSDLLICGFLKCLPESSKN